MLKINTLLSQSTGTTISTNIGVILSRKANIRGHVATACRSEHLNINIINSSSSFIHNIVYRYTTCRFELYHRILCPCLRSLWISICIITIIISSISIIISSISSTSLISSLSLNILYALSTLAAAGGCTSATCLLIGISGLLILVSRNGQAIDNTACMGSYLHIASLDESLAISVLCFLVLHHGQGFHIVIHNAGTHTDRANLRAGQITGNTNHNSIVIGG